MRFRTLMLLSFALPAMTIGQACSCDPSLSDGGPVDMGVDMNSCTGTVCAATDQCILPPDDPNSLCAPPTSPGLNWTCSGAPRFDQTACAYVCDSCQPPLPLKPGFMAQYLDSVAFTDGAGGERVGISGYSPAWLDANHIVWPYGDLVYSEFTPGGAEVVQYSILDGKPVDDVNTNIQFDPAGWRGGNADPGEDVGYYSSITASATGDLYIAYVDFTPGAFQLKLARRPAGQTNFIISTIDDSQLVTVGGAFYPSITMSNGNPVVAYGVREKALSPDAQPRGWIQVATASSAAPNGTGDWTVAPLTETIADVGCKSGDNLCGQGARCVAVGTTGRGECVVPDQTCTETCSGMFGTVSICHETLCRNVKTGSDLVDTVGVGIELHPVGTGLALAYHDRSAGQFTGTMCETDAQCGLAFCSGATPDVPNDNDGRCVMPNGNLWGLRFDGTTWSSRFLIDGYSRRQATVGDCGQHVSLAVDGSGIWHLAYLDGSFDRLRYARVETNNTVSQYAFIDDGTPAPTRPADRLDGRRRLLGGDISIALSAAGELRVLYQDLTGPSNPDPTAIPPGVQPLLAYRNASDMASTAWTVEYAGQNLSNAGWWVVQSLGITAGTSNTSYCVWADRTSNSNSTDPNEFPIEDGAETHVTTCRVGP